MIAVVSFHPIVGGCLVSVLDAPFSGGFVLSLRWFALGVSFGRYPEAQKSVKILPPAQLSGKHDLPFVRELRSQKRKA